MLTVHTTSSQRHLTFLCRGGAPGSAPPAARAAPAPAFAAATARSAARMGRLGVPAAQTETWHKHARGWPSTHAVLCLILTTATVSFHVQDALHHKDIARYRPAPLESPSGNGTDLGLTPRSSRSRTEQRAPAGPTALRRRLRHERPGGGHPNAPGRAAQPTAAVRTGEPQACAGGAPDRGPPPR